MQINKQITNEKEKMELSALKIALNALSEEKRALFHEHAPLLLDALEKISPENTDYNEIREIASLSARAGTFSLAFGVLDGFKKTNVYKSALNFHPYINQRLIKTLPNQAFIRYFEATEDPDARHYLKNEFIHRFGAKFLDYVVKGNKTAIEAMLNRCPELLSYRDDVLLKNGKVVNVSALELDYYIHHLKFNCVLDACLNQSFDIDIDAIRKPLGDALLHHTIRGNQDEVVKILNRYPTLLTYRGNVDDYSNRQFKNVTAIELTVWAWDVRHMAPAILKCLTDNALGRNFTEELAAELNNQYNAVTRDDGGVTYVIGCSLLKSSKDPSQLPELERDLLLNKLLHRRNGLIQHEDKFYYFNNLSYPKTLAPITDPTHIEALKALINKQGRILQTDHVEVINQEEELLIIQDNITDAHHIIKEKCYQFKHIIEALEMFPDDSSNSASLYSHWVTVLGLAQFYVPAHVAHHYCNKNVGFEPTPQFKEDALVRRLEINQEQRNGAGNERNTGVWWNTNYDDSYKDDLLGIECGLIRKNLVFSHAQLSLACFVRDRKPDLEAITALQHARKKDLTALKRQLVSLQRPSASASCAIQ